MDFINKDKNDLIVEAIKEPAVARKLLNAGVDLGCYRDKAIESSLEDSMQSYGLLADGIDIGEYRDDAIRQALKEPTWARNLLEKGVDLSEHTASAVEMCINSTNFALGILSGRIKLGAYSEKFGERAAALVIEDAYASYMALKDNSHLYGYREAAIEKALECDSYAHALLVQDIDLGDHRECAIDKAKEFMNKLSHKDNISSSYYAYMIFIFETKVLNKF